MHHIRDNHDKCESGSISSLKLMATNLNYSLLSSAAAVAFQNLIKCTNTNSGKNKSHWSEWFSLSSRKKTQFRQTIKINKSLKHSPNQPLIYGMTNHMTAVGFNHVLSKQLSNDCMEDKTKRTPVCTSSQNFLPLNTRCELWMNGSKYVYMALFHGVISDD